MRGMIIIAVVLFSTAFIAPQEQAQYSNPSGAPMSATTVPLSQQMQPAELVRMLKTSGTERPLILQVGSRVMFAQAHIPGSIYAGPGSTSTGLHLLEMKVESIPKGRFIVIYCGCCPWNKCPNMGPAYKRLRDLGFTNVKALYIASNFGDDWVAKGYAADKGE